MKTSQGKLKLKNPDQGWDETFDFENFKRFSSDSGFDVSNFNSASSLIVILFISFYSSPYLVLNHNPK